MIRGPEKKKLTYVNYFFFLAAFFLVAFFLVAFLAFFFAAMSTTPLCSSGSERLSPPPKNVNNMNYLLFELQIGLDIQKARKRAMCKKPAFYKG